MQLAARQGDGWITLGRSVDEELSCFDVVSKQILKLDTILTEVGRETSNFERVLVNGFSRDRPLDSFAAFVDWAGRYKNLGITELVVHWPEPNTLFEADMNIFERIATDALAEI